MLPRRPLSPSRLAAVRPVGTYVVLALMLMLRSTPGGSAAAQEGFSESISVSLVLVPVVVRERDGGLVTHLDRKDFRLEVAGQEIPIETFDEGGEIPVSLVFLQDLSGSMGNGGKLEVSRHTLEYFLARAKARDEMALASFTDGRLGIDIPFTQDHAVLREALQLWQPYGTTALHDAVAWIPEISDEGRHPKRAVVLVTDGIDNASTIEPALARQMVQKARLPVYVIGLGEDSAAVEGSYAQLLQRLARTTGGRYFAAAAPTDVARAASTVVNELRSQFVLGFRAQSSEAPAFRAIRVRVKGGARSVEHRKGYRGGPPARR
ncbi:MAG: VWA domain-containing protein [Acidobacteriota bacterium]